MNPGGIRADLVANRPGRADQAAVTFADAFEVQPFGNTLVTLTLTGAQVTSLLQAQFGSRADPRILQVSRELSYRYTYDRATRTGRIKSVRVNGVALDPKRSYRVTVNSFLAGGGDGFAVLKDAPGRKDHGSDIDALTAYLGKKSSTKAPLEPQRVPSRIQGDGCR